MNMQVILLLGVCTAVAWGDYPTAVHPRPPVHPVHPPAPVYPVHPPVHPVQPPVHRYPIPQPGYIGSGGGKGKGSGPYVAGSGGKGQGGKGQGGKGQGGYDAGSGGKGKGSSKGGEYDHIDFGPPRWVVEPVTQYREVEVRRPVTVYKTSYVKQPYTTYKKVLKPAPKLINKPVTTYTQEWRQVPVPQVTYQEVWVHPYYEEEKEKSEKGCWFCGKGKGDTKGGKGEEAIVNHPGFHQGPRPTYPQRQPPTHYGPPPIVGPLPTPPKHYGPPPREGSLPPPAPRHPAPNAPYIQH